MALTQFTACLTLCAPVGMTEQERADWMMVAQQTVGHYPADILEHACAEARRHCDHPAKIVPKIIAVAEPMLASRKAWLRDLEARMRPPEPEKPLVPAAAIGALIKAVDRGPQAVEKVIRRVEGMGEA